ncbi:helix-turn-helix transcriptional regulator [Bdellovibrio sp. 22V]|uniref:helix-turn-helix domain-containing protein n=1 Tax=Bdellovibrio TaxID=958 RepID=UPI0025434F66|nr:helix-turn-helix transcriptional regulator [Bdellovibrio sp. 22V]WII72777.1 helix-turn-helix transcriptional regulator [Bdellovibrio sp. 22V]
MNKCGDFLKKSREAQNLSQKDVASFFEYNTPQFISNWERGLSLPPVPTIRKLAKLYKISAEKLFELILEEQLFLTEKSLREKFEEDKKRKRS